METATVRKMIPVSAKLLAGKLYVAWRSYPQTRAALREMPTGAPVFITGTHRSGTTWFGRMLATPGMWYLHEPFNPVRGLWQEWFSYASDNQPSAEVDWLMQCLLRGKHRETLNLDWTEHWAMPLRLLPQPIHRILIKDPIACLLSDYLTQRFGLQTIVLFRHPAGFVSSVRRLRWPCTDKLKSLLANRPLMEDWLEPHREQLEFASNSEDTQAAATLSGALNTVLWGFTQRNPRMTSYQFEDLCRSPIDMFRDIFQSLALPYNDSIRAMHGDLCNQESRGITDYRVHEVRRHSSDMADSWRQQLASREVDTVRRVWERFPVPLYRDGSDW